MIFVLRAFAFLLALAAGPAAAQLSIEITGGGTNQIPIAIAPFAGETALPQSLTDVIDADLARSGRFKTLYTGPQNLSEASDRKSVV